jgi:hypothetical protein
MQLTKPWITKGMRKSNKIKNRLFNYGDKDKYKFYRNKILTLTRQSKKDYYYRYFEYNFENTKNTWEGINELINRKKQSTRAIPSLKCPISNRMIYDESKFPNIFKTKVSFQILKRMGKKSYGSYLNRPEPPGPIVRNSYWCVLPTWTDN